MRLPTLTAERGIGPTRGTYRSASPAAMGNGTTARVLAPMALMNRTVRQWPGSAPCDASETTCWGDQNSPFATSYVCCPQNSTCFVAGDGHPDCDADSMVRNVLTLPSGAQVIPAPPVVA